jgi:hypothetical protein
VHASWKFKVVLEKDHRGFFIHRSDGTHGIEGTDGEALEFAARVHAHYRERNVLHVEAWSSGLVDLMVPNAARPRVIQSLRPHHSRRGWVGEHVGWYMILEQAIGYGAFRSKGVVSEVQIFNARNLLERLVLIDQTDETVFGRPNYSGVLCIGGTAMSMARTSDSVGPDADQYRDVGAPA